MSVEYVDTHEREPFGTASGAHFCSFTYATQVPGLSEIDLNEGHYGYLHERTHWQTQIGTSAGLYLAAIRHAKDLVTYTYLHNNRSNLSKLMGILSGSRTPIRQRFKYHEISDFIDNGDSDKQLRRLARLKLAERAYLSLSTLEPKIRFSDPHMHPIKLGLASLDETENEVLFLIDKKEMRPKRHPFYERMAIFDDSNGSACCRWNGLPIDTVDLFEAFSVIMELIRALREEDDKYFHHRYAILRDSGYWRPIHWLFNYLGIELTVESFAKCHIMTLILLDISLNPPTFLDTASQAEDATSSRFFPSVRYYDAARLIKKWRLMHDPQMASDLMSLDGADALYQRLSATLNGGALPAASSLKLPGLNRIDSIWGNKFQAPGWDSNVAWFEFQYWLYERFRRDVAATGRKCLTTYIISGLQSSASYNRLDHLAWNPPIIFYEQNNFLIPQLLGDEFVHFMMRRGSTCYAFDDLLFEVLPPRLSPFDKRHPDLFGGLRDPILDDIENGLDLPGFACREKI
jgi:hypothetical protein